MKWMMIALVGALGCAGCMTATQEPTPTPPTLPAPVSLEDLDYQIKITKEFIGKYKDQAFLYENKAQSLFSHDILGYRDAETLSQQSQSIVNDLTKHLQQLEEQRTKMAQRQPSPPVSK